MKGPCRAGTAKKIRFRSSPPQKKNCVVSVLMSTFMYLCVIYIFHQSVSCSRISRPIVGIHKSLTDTWMYRIMYLQWVQEIFFLPGFLSRPNSKYFFLLYTISIHLSPLPNNKQPVVLGHLSAVCVSGLVPTCHLSTLKKHCFAGAGLPIHMIGEVSWEPKRRWAWASWYINSSMCARHVKFSSTS